jgi:hypothetical protein
LASVDITTQKVNWKQKFSQIPPNPIPVVDADTIYTVSGPYLIALNAVNGVPRWQVATGLQINQPCAVSKDAVYVVSIDGKVMGYTHDRDKLTKNPVDLGTSAISAPTAVGKKLIVPTTAGGMLMVDPDKGVVWNYLIRPLAGTTTSSGTGNSGSTRPGGSPGQSQDEKPLTIQPAGPATIDGSTLLIAARDGSLLAFDRATGVDLTAPAVKMVFPNPGDQVSGQPPLLLAFKLSDEASGIDLSSLKVDIDGMNYEYSFNKDGLMLVRFSLTGNNKPLSDGRRQITIMASDYMGNMAKVPFALTIDNTLKPIVIPGSDTNGGGPGAGPGGKGGGGAGGGLGGR